MIEAIILIIANDVQIDEVYGGGMMSRMSTTVRAIIWIVVLGVIAWTGYALLGVQTGVPVAEVTVATSTPAAAEPIKIGFIAPLSGDTVVYGEPVRTMVAIAVDEINALGGISGQQISMMYEDGKCNDKDGANAAQKLINIDGVKVIIGGFCSSESLAAIPIAEAGQVALLSSGSSSPELTGKSRFYARNYPSDASQGKVLAHAAHITKKWTKVVIIQEQTDYAVGISNAFIKHFEEIGGKKVVKEEFPSTTTDFRSMLKKLKATKPNALFINTQTPAAFAEILKQLAEVKWNPNFIVNDGIAGDLKMVEVNKVVLEGSLAAEFGTDPTNVKFQGMIAAYKAKYGQEPPYQSYMQTAYDAVYILKDAITAVGNDGAKIADWLKTMNNWMGAAGSVTIGADGDLVGGYVLKVIKAGKVEIYPLPAAASTATTTPAAITPTKP